MYLDNAATTQKPKAVLDRLQKFYAEQNGNINRGMHPLAEAATLLAFGGAMTFYLGILNRENPSPNPWVDYFKAKLG